MNESAQGALNEAQRAEPTGEEQTNTLPSAQTGASPDASAGTAESFSRSDVDKAVQNAVKKAKSEWDEAQRLARMSEDERERAQFEKEKKQLQSDRAALEREKLVAETGRQLANKKLPSEFAKLLTGADAEETNANIGAFESAFGRALEAAVNDRLKGKTPKGADNAGAQTDAFIEGLRRGAGLK